MLRLPSQALEALIFFVHCWTFQRLYGFANHDSGARCADFLEGLIMSASDTDLTKVERDTWEAPAMVRLDAADAENEIGVTGEGASGMGMQAS